MANPEPLLRSIELVEQRLTESVTIRDMADAACWSLYHFCRVFTQALGMGPYDYLIRRRVTEAAGVLVSGGRKITDVAFEYQFSSPETFSRCFRRALGVLPSRLQDKPDPAAGRLLPRAGQELVRLVADPGTRPVVAPVALERLQLRGHAMLLACRSPTLAALDPTPGLVRLGSLTPGPSGERWGVLCRASDDTATLFSGTPAGEPAPPDPVPVLKLLPGASCAKVSSPSAGVRLGELRSFFHDLWYPTSAARRQGDVEIYRVAGPDAERGMELLVPMAEEPGEP